MTRWGTGRFAVWAAGLALAAGLAIAILGGGRGATAAGWAVAGWLPMAVIGVAGGMWLNHKHGKPGAGFLIALGTCMLARLIVAAGGVIVALSRQPDLFWPYLAGLGAGYLPLQVFESVWFARRARDERSSTERPGAALAQRSSRA